ncbi:MAG: hypothetical protein P8016_14155 [Sedimentisphaerales bacterium]
MLNSKNKPNSLKTTKSLRLSDFAGLVINPASSDDYLSGRNPVMPDAVINKANLDKDTEHRL